MFFFTLMAALLGSPAVYVAAEQNGNNIPQVGADDGAYHIGPEDVLDISVWKMPTSPAKSRYGRTGRSRCLW